MIVAWLAFWEWCRFFILRKWCLNDILGIASTESQKESKEETQEKRGEVMKKPALGLVLFLNNLFVDNTPLFSSLHFLNFEAMNIKQKFGLKVKELRKIKNLSQEKLANLAEIDRTYLPTIEKGERNVSIEVVERLAKALDVKIKDLFDE
ncbi:helix-turn-helix transcriptional regulator [uncultured Flavobacterium sp.]|uniref:helix-turn-helix domain-containing protein n=1 Tax=uncultured Flavobacterium sp. TaxID=165435 RepID=UPI0030C7DBF9